MAASSSSGSSKASDAKKEDLEEQIAALRADFAKLADTLGGLGKAQAEELKGRASAKAAEARQMSADALAAAEAGARELEADMARRVRERPFVALGLAAAVGFVAALIARR